MVIYSENCTSHEKKPLSRYHCVVDIITSITAEWTSYWQNMELGGGGGNWRAGIEKLPGKQENTHFVCTKREGLLLK